MSTKRLKKGEEIVGKIKVNGSLLLLCPILHFALPTTHLTESLPYQRAKKVVCDSPGLVDFAIRLVVFVLNLPNGQLLFFGKFKLQKDCNQSC